MKAESTEDVVLIVLSVIVLAAGLVGSYFSARLLFEAQLDAERGLEPTDPKSLRKIAAGHIRSERNRLITQLCFLVIAAATLYAAFVDIGFWLRIVVRVASLVGILLVNANSYLNARTRHEALELIAQERRNGNGFGNGSHRHD